MFLIDEIFYTDSWDKFVYFCNDKSFTEQLGILKYEDIHTNYLASLLKENNCYGYGLTPFKLFLSLLQKLGEEQHKKCFENIDFDKPIDISHLRVSLRRPVKYGIVDLYISVSINKRDYLIILEAKFFSSEHGNQCDKYFQSLKDISLDGEKVFLYLTLNKEPCDSNEYLLLSYQDLIDYFYNPLLSMPSKDVSISVEEYLKSFLIVYEDNYSNLSYYPTLMKGNELAISLWKKLMQYSDFLEEDGFWKELYFKNSFATRILFIYILKSGILSEKMYSVVYSYYKRMSYKISFKGSILNITNGIGILLSDLIDEYSISDIESLDSRILSTSRGWMNLVKIEDLNMLPEKKRQYYVHYLSIGGVSYYYYQSSENDVDNFIRALLESYPYYSDLIQKVPYIK